MVTRDIKFVVMGNKQLSYLFVTFKFRYPVLRENKRFSYIFYREILQATLEQRQTDSEKLGSYIFSVK